MLGEVTAMPPEGRQVVTGAFGFLGRHIASQLLEQGKEVASLTGSSRPDPFGGRVSVHPLDFTQPQALVRSLQGAAVLYNTYWIRFPMGTMTFDQAVRNSRALFAAAAEAGVSRVVHVSITNPSEDSPFDYFRGKALVERALAESGLSHAILRPAVLVGDQGILINNIAWALRRMPVFGLFGDGEYRLQPIFVKELATLAVQQGAAEANVTLDAIGPETFTFRGLVEEIAAAIDVRTMVVSMPPALALATVSLMGKFVSDEIVTRDEMRAMMAGLLCTQSPPTGSMRLSAWLRQNSGTLGREYMSEKGRRRA
jgi:NADH dehydrogenase